ncbi:LPS export ABC transporter periplasmic protein LptC [Roseomonas xinghualingensis]|uniref:LPS export ABC transporter periplasmic protein LptC n=1 Tax=Roseomonas xinghualingensis TaxID=2986475 RepID=UPI0021F15332|nr:LPS export ABC transporter periplasmic protein LptC [Roseomonas sp. SXEYE001]MCV4207996.1 LPS export ABC transporter periplasmic protein LptC [Roseomonas sp. SXEYE001]
MTTRAPSPAEAVPNAGPEGHGNSSAPSAPDATDAAVTWAERLVPSRARRIYTRGSIRRRRVMVRLLKVLLPLGALGLLATIVLWPEFEQAGESARLSFRRLSRVTPEAVRVVEPRYQGTDETGRPFNVTASLASQQGTANVVDLEEPRGDLTQGNGSWVLVESRTGRFDRDASILDLRDDVTIWQDDGTLIETQEARVDVKGGNAEGDRPIAAQGSFGTVTGEGFRLRDRGAVVVFTGHARAMLEGGK